jgi:Nitric oxide reductase activation protein
LLDQSLSTDGYVENHRIIDLEKEALIVLGDVLKDIPIYISIAGFYSITRNQIYFNLIKDFKEPWDNAFKKIGAIQPQGYTRIGAAIRHANSLLNQFSYAQKWIILLSDGKPNDYDKYEGKYGIFDIQQAIREGRKNQIHFFGIALEKEAKYYLPLMFGQNHYKILDHPNHLFETLTTLILKISHQT